MYLVCYPCECGGVCLAISCSKESVLEVSDKVIEVRGVPVP